MQDILKKENHTGLPMFGLPRILPFVRPYRLTVAAMIAMGIFSSLADALYPLFDRYVLDHFIGEKTLSGMPLFAALYILLITAQQAVNYWSMCMCGSVEMRVDRDLRNTAFSHLQDLSVSYFNRNSVGYIHARVMSDTGKIGELVAWRMMDMVWYLSYLIFVFIMMFAIHPRLALYVTALVPAAAVLISVFQGRLAVLNREVRELNARITGDFNEGVTGARSIKVLGTEERMKGLFRKDSLHMRRTAVKAGHYSALFISSVTLLSSAALAVVLWKGGMLTRERLMGIGTLSVFMSYAVSLLEPVQVMIETIASLVAIRVNIERFTDLLAEQTEVRDLPRVIEKYGDNFEPKKENWEPLLGEIEFRDVTFRYPDGEENVLEHFNLRVAPGQRVAIVGETGAGKSTLVNLVCRFFDPTEGQLMIDGRDARERSLLWLHSNIGYVQQSPYLFSGSIRENMRYGRPEASDGEIMDALRLVSADHITERMPEGLDSTVGEGGDRLSTGEKQLFSMARALLSDPAILIMDEATSSVDTVTEERLQKAVEAVVRGRTSFIIAHRLSTIIHADMILAVKDGVIAEQGTHEELLKKQGYYCRLYRQHFSGV